MELALLDGHQETRGTEGLGRHGLSGARSCAVLGTEAEHILDLLGRVLLSAAEDIRLAALRIPEFMYLRLVGTVSYSA